MLDAVFLEFDGIVAATRELQRGAVLRALADEGLEVPPAWHTEPGRSVARVLDDVLAHVRREHDTVLRDLLVWRAESHFSASLGKGVALVPGAREALERLSLATRVGVVTRLRRTDIHPLLALGGLEPAIAFVIAADDTPPPEPRITAYALALRRLALAASRAPRVVALEDGLEGIRAARQAGLTSVAVGPLPAHIAMEAHGYVATLADVEMDALAALALRQS